MEHKIEAAEKQRCHPGGCGCHSRLNWWHHCAVPLDTMFGLWFMAEDTWRKDGSSGSYTSCPPGLCCRSSTWAGNVRLQPRKPTVPWAASGEAWPTVWGTWFCPFTLLLWDPTWSPASSSGAPNIARTWRCWSGSRGGSQRWSEGWRISPVRKVGDPAWAGGLD